MESIENIAPLLLEWFRQHKRWMPWRETKQPYHIWVSEIMLQQTRVETVIGYYQRFMQRYPTVEALAQAAEEEVLKSWEGLGYYSRCRNLHKAAKVIAEVYGGKLPDTEKELLQLPGIGPYTVGAILSIAFNQPVPAVDGNVLRVYSRLYCIEQDILEKQTQEQVRRLVKDHMPAGACGDFSEALMELGATICTPQNPRCQACPLQVLCRGFAENRLEELPLRINKTKVKKHHKIILWVTLQDRVLIRKNPPEGLLASLWTLPTLELDQPGQEEALITSYLEANRLEAESIQPVGKLTHVYTHQRWENTLYLVPCAGTEQPVAPSEEVQFVDRFQLEKLTFSTLYRKAMNLVYRYLKNKLTN